MPSFSAWRLPLSRNIREVIAMTKG
jgi:hypothetical protein